MTNEREKNMLDVGVEIVEKAIQRGYVQAWFSWLGWITVSSVIYVLGSTAHSLVVQALGAISILVTFLAGLVGLERLRDDWLDAKKDKLSRRKNMFVVLSLAAIGVYVIFEILGVVFKVTLSNGA